MGSEYVKLESNGLRAMNTFLYIRLYIQTNVEQRVTGLMGGVKVESQMEATVPSVSDDSKVEVVSCFGLGSLVMSWLAQGKFLKV